MSKCSLNCLRPGYDTQSAVADARRPAYTVSSARKHKRMNMLIPVRAASVHSVPTYMVHTMPVQNATLLREESKVARDQTREYLGPSLLGSSPPDCGSRVQARWQSPATPPPLATELVLRVQTAFMSDSPLGLRSLRTGSATTSHLSLLSGHRHLSQREANPITNGRKGTGRAMVGGYQT